jgi:hypothetical protein
MRPTLKLNRHNTYDVTYRRLASSDKTEHTAKDVVADSVVEAATFVRRANLQYWSFCGVEVVSVKLVGSVLAVAP